MEVLADPADVTTKAAAGDEGQWSTSTGWFGYDKNGCLALLVGTYIEWTQKNNLYRGERRPGYRAHCHSELQPGASVVANGEGPCKGATSSPFLAGVVLSAI
jgi:hypothetical protein